MKVETTSARTPWKLPQPKVATTKKEPKKRRLSAQFLNESAKRTLAQNGGVAGE